MYGIFNYIWMIYDDFGVNVDTYSIHGAYCMGYIISPSFIINHPSWASLLLLLFPARPTGQLAWWTMALKHQKLGMMDLSMYHVLQLQKVKTMDSNRTQLLDPTCLFFSPW
jgi:hypothetical protein